MTKAVSGFYQYAQHVFDTYPNNIVLIGKTYALVDIGFSDNSSYLQLGAGTGAPFAATSLLLGTNVGGFWFLPGLYE